VRCRVGRVDRHLADGVDHLVGLACR
jgi:hypothetical protein